MLNNIKSTYFLKYIFSYLTKNLRLDIVKYNKKLQNLIDINFINWGKYLIYEMNSKGKEYWYNNNILIFEGEYSKGKRNGKGKEFNNEGIIIFEGEYLNGKRNGEGKEYDYNGYLIFEGEYLNGKRWNGIGYDKNNIKINEIIDGKGYIKEYNIKESYLEFEGEYLNGEKNGKGKEYDYLNNLIFEGEYMNGKRWNGIILNKKENKTYLVQNGKGFVKEYNSKEKYNYETQYLNGEKNGLVKIYYLYKKLIYVGEYKDGKKSGLGKEYSLLNNLRFDGEYNYDKKVKGKLYIKGVLEFEGEFLYNKKWDGKGYDIYGNVSYELIKGKGKVKEYNNYDILIFDGEYINGRKNGKGKEYDKDGKLLFEGEYLNNKKWNGNLYDSDNNIICELKSGRGDIKRRDKWSGQIIFEGEYLDGEINGIGKDYDYHTGFIRFEDEYLNGKRNGKGKAYDTYGSLIFEGEYKYGYKNGLGKEYLNNKIIFEGEYLNGEKNGKGKEYYNDKIIFEGEYLNGEMWNGIIRKYNTNNEVIECLLSNGAIVN